MQGGSSSTVGPVTNTQSYEMAMSRRQIPGAIPVLKFGRTYQGGAAETSVSTIPGASGQVYPWQYWDAVPKAGVSLAVWSTSDQDKPGGLGASHVVLIGLSNGFWLAEEVELNGTTKVYTDMTYNPIFRMYVSHHNVPGPSARNIGRIISAIDDEGVFNEILDIVDVPGRVFNQSLSAAFKIPDNYEGLLTQIDVSQANTSGKIADVGLYRRAAGADVFQNILPATAGSQGINTIRFAGSYRLEAGDEFELRVAMESATTAVVSGILDMYVHPLPGVPDAEKIDENTIVGAVL